MNDKLIPFAVGCEQIGYSAQHVRRLIRQGKFPHPIRLHDGGRPYLTEKMLEALIAKRAAVAARCGKGA